MEAKDRIIFALDVDDAPSALSLVSQLKDSVGAFKVGLELFTATGPDLVKRIMDEGAKVFLDLKFHDIPNTVEGAVKSAAKLNVWLMNLHATAGYAAMHRAAVAAREAGGNTKVIAVTVLTSSSAKVLKEVGIAHTPEELVLILAELAKNAGMDGVVASPQEAGAIRSRWREGLIVTPGVRPAGAALNDQSRIATPEGAIKSGADYLVIGRPIREAADPVAAAKAIADEIAGALKK